MQRAREDFTSAFELAACFSFGLHQLQPILNRFRLAFPKTEIHIRYEHIDRVHELALAKEADIGLVAYPRRQPSRPRSPAACWRRFPLRTGAMPDRWASSDGKTGN
jgi:DNA-binding transcriptional LysR family regulator